MQRYMYGRHSKGSVSFIKILLQQYDFGATGYFASARFKVIFHLHTFIR